LGLKFEYRHGKEYYTSQLRTEHIDLIKKAETEQSFLQLVNTWLERMPFSPSPTTFLNVQDGAKAPSREEVEPQSFKTENDSFGIQNGAKKVWDFWSDYKKSYANSLAEAEKDNLNAFDEVFFQQRESHYTFSAKANRAALFIMLYRGYPMLQTPFQLLNNLLEIDEQLSTWRHRHMNMVHRMIGTRIGTGGSSGKDYLKAAADKHYIFKEIAQLTSFLIERRKLPQLPKEIEEKLGFAGPGPLPPGGESPLSPSGGT
jgi:tryptophan 2,3-dioxygenase